MKMDSVDGKQKQKKKVHKIVDIDSLNILAKDSDEEKHQKIEAFFKLTKAYFIEAIASWVEVNAEALAKQLVYVAPFGKYENLLKTTPTIQSFFEKNLGDPKYWSIAAANEEYIQDPFTKEEMSKLVDASNADEVTDEQLEDYLSAYVKLQSYGLHTVKFTFIGNKELMADAEHLNGVVYVNENLEIIHAFAVWTQY